MVTIRLTRHGSKKRPFYQIIVANKLSARDGRFIERIGFFNQVNTYNGMKEVSLNLDRVSYWIKNGATISVRVASLIKKLSNKS